MDDAQFERVYDRAVETGMAMAGAAQVEHIGLTVFV